MSVLAELIAGWAQPGRVAWIGIRPERRAGIFALDEVVISEAGLDGDRSRAGRRSVTLIQQEHLAAIGSYLGRGPVAPEVLRRNLVVSGINLMALKGREVKVGEASLRFTVICAPCSRMEEALGRGATLPCEGMADGVPRCCGPVASGWGMRCNR